MNKLRDGKLAEIIAESELEIAISQYIDNRAQADLDLTDTIK